MSQITLTLDLTPENTSVLCEMLPRLVLTGATIGNESRQMSFTGNAANEITQPQVEDTPAEDTPAEDTAPATTAKKDKAKPAAKQNAAPAAKAPTMTDVRAVALKLSKAGRQDDLKKIFAKYGADKLSGVAEDNYTALMADLTEASDET